MRLVWGAVGVAIILGIAYFVNEDRLAKQRMEQVRWAPIEHVPMTLSIVNLNSTDIAPQTGMKCLNSL